MKSTKYLLIIIVVFLFLLLVNCSLLNLSGNNTKKEETGYYSKEVEVSRYVDPGNSFLEPVQSYIYDENGKLAAVFEYLYEDVNADGYYLNNRTNIYKVDENGNKTLVEYYKYTYRKDTYEYIDDDGITQSDFDYELLTGEVYSTNDTADDETDDVKVKYYIVTYTANDDTIYEDYLSIIDYDKDGNITNRQDDTYITDGGGDRRYRTEKYYSLDDPSDPNTLSLSNEYAAWYDSNDPYDCLYELYHSVRSNSGTDEFYYYTKYERNDSENIYQQTDYEYDDPAVPTLNAGDYQDGSLDDSGSYDIVFGAIGKMATVLKSEYDPKGNVIRDNRFLDGQLKEYTIYRYNNDSELTDKVRYTNGGSFIHDRTSIRYRDETRDGVYNRIKETFIYKYYDYESTG
ncbi:MAG: hypothetical protein GXP33_09400, partial [Spirochaetes bacterium]|nr:hypothetical protein [Spirochaetota bacterium]